MTNNVVATLVKTGRMQQHTTIGSRVWEQGGGQNHLITSRGWVDLLLRTRGRW